MFYLILGKKKIINVSQIIISLLELIQNIYAISQKYIILYTITKIITYIIIKGYKLNVCRIILSCRLSCMTLSIIFLINLKNCRMKNHYII